MNAPTKIKAAFDTNPKLVNLLVDPFFAGELGKAQSGWRRVVGAAAASGIPCPCVPIAVPVPGTDPALPS